MNYTIQCTYGARLQITHKFAHHCDFLAWMKALCGSSIYAEHSRFLTFLKGYKVITHLECDPDTHAVTSVTFEVK